MNKKIKYLLYGIVLLAAGYYGFVQLSGFSQNKIYSDFTFNEKWEPSSPLSKQEQSIVDPILDQPFFFLGKGVQCYAFISQDNTTVLKVFKHYHMWPDNPFLKKVHLPGFFDTYKQQVVHDREKRVKQIYDSCHTAYEHYKEESALIYIHLNKTHLFNKQITLHDKLGISHTIDADSIPFVLQKKADLVYPTLHSFMKKKDEDGARKLIDGILNLIVKRCQKGIANQDAMIVRNYGYLGTNAVEIDIGSFRVDPTLKKPRAYKKELFYEARQLQNWIKNNYPELLNYLNERMELMLNDEI